MNDENKTKVKFFLNSHFFSPNYDFDFIVGKTVFNTKRYGDGFSET